MRVEITLDELRRLEKAGRVILADGSTLELVLVKPNATATGAEIRDFFNNGWDMDYYHESDTAQILLQDEEGEWLLRDEGVYELSKLGELYWQGQGVNLTRGKKPSGMTFEKAFLKWKESK